MNIKQDMEQPITTSFQQNDLLMHCAYAADGKLIAKQENYGDFINNYDYTYDMDGHLTQVIRNGQLNELYTYNQLGQRVGQAANSINSYTERVQNENLAYLQYDAKGRLIQAGNESLSYDQNGALAQKSGSFGDTFFRYGGITGTQLQVVLLPSGEDLIYEYDEAAQDAWTEGQVPANLLGLDPVNPPRPVRRFRCGELVTEYVYETAQDVRPAISLAEGDGLQGELCSPPQTSPIGSGATGRSPRPSSVWKTSTHLAAYIDYENGLEYSFFYNENGFVDRIRIAQLTADRFRAVQDVHPRQAKVNRANMSLADALWGNSNRIGPRDLNNRPLGIGWLRVYP